MLLSLKFSYWDAFAKSKLRYLFKSDYENNLDVENLVR